MALSANQKAALNRLQLHIPELKHQPTGSEPINLGDELDAKSEKVATIASADASDLATAITLVNEIKAALNAIA